MCEENLLCLLFLRVMTLWRRGTVVPFSVVSPVPQCLVLLRVPPMCAVLLCHFCFILQASHLQRLSLLVVGSVWSLDWIWHILTRCSLVCLWNETCCHWHWNRGLTKLLDWETWCWQGFGPVFCSKDLLHWDWGKHDWEGQFSWNMGVGLGVSKLGSKCRHHTGSCRWPCAFAGWGEGNSACQFLCTQKGLSMNAASGTCSERSN